VKLFTVISKRNISIREKLEKIQSILRINTPPDVSALVVITIGTLLCTLHGK
jgi:SUMO ligase MMS21 Smc5/6 complex component